MKFEISVGARAILQTLMDGGYEACLVGGCVRDLLRGAVPHDWDICPSGGDCGLLCPPKGAGNGDEAWDGNRTGGRRAL